MMAVCNAIMLSEVRSGFRIDSEFYKEEYIEKDYLLSRINTVPLWRISKITDGEHGSVTFVQNGIKYLTAEHIKQGYVDFNGVRFISKEVDQRNARARVNKGDILVSIKGTLGEIALAEQFLLPANMNRDVAVIKLYSNSPSGAYITPFLRSDFGAYQLSREGSGGVQQMITLERLKCVLIPILDNKLQNEIESLHLNGLSVRQKSVALYSKAQHLLESELGLDKLKFKKPMGYTARFSEVEQSRRLDAQHFQPRFDQIIDQLSNYDTERVRDIRLYNRRGVQPVYFDDGPVSVVNSQHIGQQHIDYESLQKTSKIAFLNTPDGHIKINDLLIYTTGAYIGRTNVYLSDQLALASNHVNILRLNSGIDAAYMALVLQSVIGQFQTQKHLRGSAQAELYPTDIDRFIVPLLDSKKQSAIGDLVRSSLEKQQESKRLLEQAKTRVERLIEEAAAGR
ncbi:MAG: restriction endonuclease subunit S [Desulfatiglandaceae bacterium]